MAATTSIGLSSTAAAAPGSVVLLTPSLDYGGAEVMIVGLAHALRASGWTVWVVSMLEPRAFVDELESADVQVASLGMKAGRANAFGILSLIRLLRQVQPDLIHAHMFHANVLARILRPLLRIPVICTVQNILESSRRKNTAWLRDWAYRLTDWSCDRTTAVAEAVRERYIRDGLAKRDRIEVVPNGVDPDRFRGDPARRPHLRRELGWSDGFHWLAVGRLELAKDYVTMLRAMKLLVEASPDAKLSIAGDGRLRSELEELARTLGLQGTVAFLGTRTDVQELMQAADAYVMSSAWEGAPVAMAEAAASGLPVVTTNVGGNAELVVQGSSGWVVPGGDPKALAEAMVRIVNAGEEARQEMGRVGRTLIEERYSHASVFQRYERLYYEVTRC